MPSAGPEVGEGAQEITPVSPEGELSFEEAGRWGLPSAGGRAQPECGAATPSYLNSPLAGPPGDLVWSVVREGDIFFSVNALRCFLSGFGELEQDETVKITSLIGLLTFPQHPRPSWARGSWAEKG